MSVTLKIKKNYEDAIIPVRQNRTDSGLDLFCYSFVKLYKNYEEALDKEAIIKKYGTCKDKPLMLHPGERVLIDTGISATVGEGYEIQIRPRSGLALKHGLTVLNTPGTIDESYRGMIGVILINISSEPVAIKIEDRIAQMVVCPVKLCEVKQVDSLDETERGSGGFGHTGV